MAIFSRRKQDDGEITELPSAPVEPPARPSRSRAMGRLLRETRQSFGGEIEAIGATLRIRPAYLEAIEEGRYDALPGPTYVLGFVRSYAEYLGLDGNEVVRRFKEETGGIDTKRDLSFPMPLAERSVPGGTMLLAALILAICGYGIWYYVSSGDRARPERVTAVPSRLVAPAPERKPEDAVAAAPAAPGGTSVAAAPSGSPPGAATAPALPGAPQSGNPGPANGMAAASLPPAGTIPLGSAPLGSAPLGSGPSAAGSPPAGSSTPSISSPAAAATRTTPIPEVPAATPATDAAHVYGVTSGPARIVIRANGDSWVQVRDSDQTLLITRVLKAGEVYRVPDRPGLTMRTGNAGMLEITVDGRSVPPVGGNGTVRRNIALDPDRLVAGNAIGE